MPNLTRYASGAIVLATLVACAHGDPVSNAGGTTGLASLITGNPSSATLPSGAAGVITSFFATNPDAFNRRAANTQYGPYFDAANHWFVYSTSSYRNGTAARLDPRIPVPQGSAAVSDVQLYPDDVDGSGWEAYIPGLNGLTASTSHTVVFVRYELHQAGALDQEERMLTGAVTQPDTLKLPAGSVMDSTDLGSGASNWPSCGAAPTQAAPNPFIIARENSSAGGVLGGGSFDKCWDPGTIWYTGDANTTYAKSMIAPQGDLATAATRYNYIEVWEGNYGTGILRLRMQIGQDYTSAGAPINNAYPPFPAPSSTNTKLPTVDKQPFPLADTLYAKLKGSSGLPQRGTVTLGFLPALANGAVYKAWYVSPQTATTSAVAVPAVGAYRRSVGGAVQPDSNLSTSTFAGGAGSISFGLADYLTTIAPKAYADSLAFFVVSVESSASAASPSTTQPLWVSLFKTATAGPGGSMKFGSFDNGSAGKIVYLPQGLATGGVLGDTVGIFVPDTVGGISALVRKLQFDGSVIEMRFAGIQRPPLGYRYAAFLRATADTTQLLDIGGLEGPDGSSLDDADTEAANSFLSTTGIAYGKTVYDAHSKSVNGAPDQICNYDRYRLYLVPKADLTAKSTLIFDVPLPDRVTKLAYRCR